eukprot:Nk52_evm9s356 gene=Nk52_evmTU9s356
MVCLESEFWSGEEGGVSKRKKSKKQQISDADVFEKMALCVPFGKSCTDSEKDEIKQKLKTEFEDKFVGSNGKKGTMEYYRLTLSLIDFINPRVRTLVRKGNLVIVSDREAGIVQNRHNTLYFTKEGQLYLTLEKDYYQRLGLSGVQSKGVCGDWYVVKVDLLNESFKKGTKYYERTVTCLSMLKELEWEVAVSYCQTDKDQSFESGKAIEEIFCATHGSAGKCIMGNGVYIDVQSAKGMLCPEPKELLSTCRDMKTPREELSSISEMLYEYCGYIGLGLDCNPESVECTENVEISEVVVLSVVGMINPQSVSEMWDTLRAIIPDNGSVPLVSYCVWHAFNSPSLHLLKSKGKERKTKSKEINIGKGPSHCNFVIFPSKTDAGEEWPYWSFTYD